MDIRKIYYLCPLKMRGEIPRSKSIRYESENICALSVYAYPDRGYLLYFLWKYFESEGREHRDDLTQVEAFFFGQAGLLEGESADDYFSWMQKEFRYLQHKFELPPVMNPSLWRFLRLRPGNFPHVRLAQLASLYYRERSLFSRVMEAETLKDLKQIFAGHTSAYWEEHFMFGKPSPRREKSIGAGAKELIIINTVIPFLYAYGLHKADERLCERAASLLEELKAENNYVTRMWSGAGIPVQTAADSQALLQLQKEYCDKKKCLYCRFGYEYLRHK